MRSVPRRESGAALLTVLLLIAVMAVVTAIALQRLTLATRMAQNGVAADQGRALLMAGEAIAAVRLGDVVAARPSRTTLAGGWLGSAQVYPVPGGQVTAKVRDAGNCFNVNSLVMPDGPDRYETRIAAVRQLAALLRLLGTDARTAEGIAWASADWIDSDALPSAGGAEDDVYRRQPVPYRTAGGLLVDPSELRIVAGMTAPIYQRVRPWLCALPQAQLSPININTLLPDQAVLLAMLTDGKLGVETARQVLASRPADGYGSTSAFWAHPALAALAPPSDAMQQTVLASRWFSVELRADLGGTQVNETALFDARTAPARLIRRRWGDDD